jgi:four helix bundle protein
MQNFRELKVWVRAHELTLAVYRASKAFPPHERYGVTGQIRRASASIATNIAEGCGRNSRAELSHFLQIASGSASEVEYSLLLARDLGFLETDSYATLTSKATETRRMLAALIRRLKTDD